MASSKKWKPAYDSQRKYNTEWEKQFPWLKKAPTGLDEAYCKLCHCTLRPKHSSLKDHQETSKHKKRQPKEGQQVINPIRTPRASNIVSDELKKVELQLAAAMACHCSISCIDHVGEIIVEHGKGSILHKIKLHRTKCLGLIKNVIAPALKEELAEDVKEKNFSLLVDESTDISVQKYLCVLVRFFSDQKMAIRTELLGLVPLVETTAEAIFQAIQGKLSSFGLDSKKCIGFSCDGASVMLGSNNSVWTRLQEVAPHCALIKCVCHSVALCVQHAVEKLPSNISFLLAEIPKWFAKSSIRRESFKDLFNVMNIAEDENIRAAPLPFQKYSSTRWLVRGKVMFNILVNWDELLAYFVAAEFSGSIRGDARYKLRMLKEMLQDKSNYLYFVFATPVVQEFEKINSLFQQTHADPNCLSNALSIHYQSLCDRLFYSNGHAKDIENVDFGMKFIDECQKIVQSNDTERTHNTVKAVKHRCQLVLQEAVEQIKKRLPSAQDVYKNLAKLNPQVILSQTSRSTFRDLPFLKLFNAQLHVIEDEYRKIHLVDWQNEAAFKEGIPSNSEKFWSSVLHHAHFKDLASYALTCLCIPVSNAVVERIFSLLTAVKTKPRNKMQTELLEAILRIRTDMLLNGKCCTNFDASAIMIRHFTSDIVYGETSSNEMAEALAFLE